MKKFLYVAMLAVLPLTAMAQHEERYGEWCSVIGRKRRFYH